MKTLYTLIVLALVSLAPVKASAVGASPVKMFRNLYATTNVTTAAYLTVLSYPSGGPISRINNIDTSTRVMVLSYASRCNLLSFPANSVILPAGGIGSVPLDIPANQCIGITGLSGTASSGELDLTLFR